MARPYRGLSYKIKPQKVTGAFHIHRTDLMLDQRQPQSPGRGVLRITAGQGVSCLALGAFIDKGMGSIPLGGTKILQAE